jgi:hypothetical protein
MTQQAGNGLADVVVIYELWRLAVAVVVQSGVYKWSVDPLANPNPVYTYSHIRNA